MAAGGEVPGWLLWLDQRTGWITALRAIRDEHVPGGPRPALALGAALAFLLLAQLSSGLALALAYAPSSTSAWESVARLESTALGHLLRGLHAHGAELIIAIAALRVLASAMLGSYRAPREVGWWAALLLLSAILAEALTGTLLPWDERGLAATQVSLSVAQSLPLAGHGLRRLFAGGPTLGNLTLARFYALHAIALPLLVCALGAAWASSVRRHGFAAPPGLLPAQRNSRSPYWPRQALYDAAFSLLLLAGLTAWAAASGAPLLAPADPSAASAARPAWYFTPFFELLKLLPGPLEPLALFLPLSAFVLLAALPFIDRESAEPGEAGDGWASRKPVALALAGGLLAALGLSLAASVADARDPEFQKRRAAAEERASVALRLARGGVPAEGALWMVENQPHLRGQRLFERKCLACHRVGDRGAQVGPHLTGYLSKSWIKGALLHPEADEYWGKSGIEGMLGVGALGEQRVQLLVELVYALRDAPEGPQQIPPAMESGRKLFESENCTRCHALAPGERSLAPILAGYGSDAWLRGLLQDAGAPGYYGVQNKMPAFEKELESQQLDDLIAYLRTLEGSR